ncbi:hypothetical protein PIB30_045326 [Stylosanthes scabra]|uniref:Uncharacterized protein n=1 Tax=Stylosanthes scabra TaxID=79078 RepID=A0ABU6XE68_9FABA|nr:hypothetical protein [Stylosanthes scabra]
MVKAPQLSVKSRASTNVGSEASKLVPHAVMAGIARQLASLPLGGAGWDFKTATLGEPGQASPSWGGLSAGRASPFDSPRGGRQDSSAVQNGNSATANSVGRTSCINPSSLFPSQRQCNVGDGGSPAGWVSRRPPVRIDATMAGTRVVGVMVRNGWRLG